MPAPPGEIVVDSHGGGDFTTVQAAINSIPTRNTAPVVITLRPGEYREKVNLPTGKNFVTLKGEDGGVAKITWDDFSGKAAGPGQPPFSTYTCCTVAVEADDFTAVNVTFENAAGPQCGGASGQNQAVALRVGGDRTAFRGCHMSGWQDTLYVHHGHHSFEDCTIDGSVDFVFGGPNTYGAFARCYLVMKSRGWFTAHYRDLGQYPQDEGAFVFESCTFSGQGAAGPGSGYLGRPWKPDSRVILYDCHLGDVVNSKGWANWDANTDPSRPTYWECRSSGPGAAASRYIGKVVGDAEVQSFVNQSPFFRSKLALAAGGGAAPPDDNVPPPGYNQPPPGGEQPGYGTQPGGPYPTPPGPGPYPTPPGPDGADQGGLGNFLSSIFGACGCGGSQQKSAVL